MPENLRTVKAISSSGTQEISGSIFKICHNYPDIPSSSLSRIEFGHYTNPISDFTPSSIVDSPSGVIIYKDACLEAPIAKCKVATGGVIVYFNA